jgi:hypothetical protein
VNSVLIRVSSTQSFIYGPLVGYFLAIRESGLAADADNFVSLAYAKPCWLPAPERKKLSHRERRRP